LKELLILKQRSRKDKPLLYTPIPPIDSAFKFYGICGYFAVRGYRPSGLANVVGHSFGTVRTMPTK